MGTLLDKLVKQLDQEKTKTDGFFTEIENTLLARISPFIEQSKQDVLETTRIELQTIDSEIRSELKEQRESFELYTHTKHEETKLSIQQQSLQISQLSQEFNTKFSEQHAEQEKISKENRHMRRLLYISFFFTIVSFLCLGYMFLRMLATS